MNGISSSPVCSAPDADDIYMGYAGGEEVLNSLQELLEAERAGARVALASSKVSSPGAYGALMKAVRADEARWCAMLSREIKRLAGTPSRKTGSFYGKAMAIGDPLQRLAFLNRGQDWVVRRLEALAPRIRDNRLHQQLHSMLDRHRSNIDLAEALLGKQRQA